MRRRAPALALLAALAASRGAVASSGKAIDGVSAGDFKFGAMSIGQAKDVDYARAEGLGLLPQKELEAYLNGVLAKLLAQSPVRGVPAHVYVRASGDWNAQTTADANIYVTLGTLLRLDNEDEIAALLGHEASHVLLGHADADLVQDVQQRAIQLSTVALAARDRVGGGAQGAAAKSGADSAHVNDQAKALMVSTLIAAPAWNREQERDADLLGTDLMVRAGYNPQAALSLLRKQAEVEKARAHDPQAKYFESQMSVMGIDVAEKAKAQSAKVAKKAGGGDAGGLLGTLMQAGIEKAAELGAKQLDEAKRSHPSADERLADERAYIEREYATAPAASLQVDPWDAAKDRDKTADVLENYIAAIEAQQKLFEGDLNAAAKLSKTGVGAATKAHAYPNYVAAAVEIQQGDAKTALGNYESALAGPEPAGAIYVEASALHLQSGKRDKAVEIIESGYRRLQEPPSLAVPLIRTYHAVGKQAEADRLAAQCALRWPKLQDVCSKEAKGGGS